MSVAKLAYGGLNAMKSSEVSKAADTHLPLFQLLNAFDHPDMSGWPFLTPVKAPTLKCEKCSREFTSSINFRRHSRVHRRSFHVNKEYNKNRDLLAAFWDKLSLEDAERVVSCDDVMLKELPGSTIIMALASSLRKPGVWSLPQAYVKAGSTLLDIIHAKPAGLPISSKELFNVLDDASENTFLCAGTADAVQKYVLDGGDSRQCLELRNLVAATSFLVERQLVNSWLADKEAEALRCHKLLVEEEEAAQKRRAELVERKRRKKIRQKEQKAKELLNRRTGDLNVVLDSIDRPTSAKEYTPPSSSVSTSDSPDSSESLDLSPDTTLSQTKEPNEDTEAHLDLRSEHIDPADSQITDLHMALANEHQRSEPIRQQASKLPRDRRNEFHANHNIPASKAEPTNKLSSFKDRAVAYNKVWAKKANTNADNESVNSPLLHADVSRLVEEDNCVLMIGSISIPLKTGAIQQEIKSSQKPQDSSTCDQPSCKEKNFEKSTLSYNAQSGLGSSQVPTKLWRPVSRGETKSTLPVLTVKKVSEEEPMLDTVQDRILSDDCGKDTAIITRDEQGNLPLSSAAAREFLDRRWKEVISSDHVVLALSPSSDVEGGEVVK